MELFANIVDCIQPLAIFAKYFILGASQGTCVFAKSKEKLGTLSFISEKIRIAISRVFDFKFSLNTDIWHYPSHSYIFKVNNRNTRTRGEISPKLTIKTPERRHWRHTGVFIVKFEHVSYLFLVFLLLALSRQMPAG